MTTTPDAPSVSEGQRGLGLRCRCTVDRDFPEYLTGELGAGDRFQFGRTLRRSLLVLVVRSPLSESISKSACAFPRCPGRPRSAQAFWRLVLLARACGFLDLGLAAGRLARLGLRAPSGPPPLRAFRHSEMCEVSSAPGAATRPVLGVGLVVLLQNCQLVLGGEGPPLVEARAAGGSTHPSSCPARQSQISHAQRHCEEDPFSPCSCCLKSRSSRCVTPVWQRVTLDGQRVDSRATRPQAPSAGRGSYGPNTAGPGGDPPGHIAEFGTAADGRIFQTERGGVVGSTAYGDVWAATRALAFTPEQVASPWLGGRTTCAMRGCHCGSTLVFRQLRSPNERAIASRSCCRSMRSASWASTTGRTSGSTMRSMTDLIYPLGAPVRAGAPSPFLLRPAGTPRTHSAYIPGPVTSGCVRWRLAACGDLGKRTASDRLHWSEAVSACVAGPGFEPG